MFLKSVLDFKRLKCIVLIIYNNNILLLNWKLYIKYLKNKLLWIIKHDSSFLNSPLF